MAVLASGSGTNLQAIIDQLHGRPAGVTGPVIEVALMVSDNPDARALERAREAGIATAVFPMGHGGSRVEHDLAMAAAIHEAGAELVVLAGYMRLVSAAFVKEFPHRIINLHPAILPAFPGTSSISDAVRYGVKVTGVTVHFVDEGLDTGPVIAQEPVRVNDGDTAESLAARIHTVEHQLLPATIRLIAAGKVRAPLPGTRVVQVDWGGNDSSDA
ncbi:MAG: phosphoribosylglycinamide formyltransferase [Thermoleophilia bacterium]|nr:phosphoribosylglycinamide formyltransferase [Thermoleophilia bacterium]